MSGPPKVTGFKRPRVDIAPDLVEEVDVALQMRGCSEVTTNLRADEMYAPAVGPAHPWKAEDVSHRNTLAGRVDESFMNPYLFEQNLRAQNRVQFTDWKTKQQSAGDPKRLRREWEEEQAKKKEEEEREGLGEATVVTKGGEVVKSDELEVAVVGNASGNMPTYIGGVAVKNFTDEADYTEGHDMYYEENRDNEKTKRVIAKKPEAKQHVGELYDYQGRHVMFDPPKKTKAVKNYPPTKLLHTFHGHNKGVHCVRWLPSVGHMFASGGMEGKVKLWSTAAPYEPVMTYNGHHRGVKDVNFNRDGTSFLSSSHDNFIRQWDTETGQVTATFSNGSLANCVKYHPNQDYQHQFFAGCTDKQLHQFDTRSGTIVRSYDQHLGAVTTCTFIDNGRQIVTTSDDKTMRLWEMDLPVTISLVSQPGMQSMPSSMDNNVLMYSAEKLALLPKKRFAGHITAGYACEVGFSSDGKYVSSGNGDGELFVWNWGNTGITKHFKCHDKVLISHAWHPTESSKLLTCSWDSKIKLWD